MYFDQDYDDYFYSPHPYWRRRAEQEKMRRRRELEEQYRRQRRLQEEDAMRRAQREREEAMAMRQAHLPRSMWYDDDEEDDYDDDVEPDYQIVRGRDGRLYRVPVTTRRPQRPAPQLSRAERPSSSVRPQMEVVRGPDGRLYRVPKQVARPSARSDKENSSPFEEKEVVQASKAATPISRSSSNCKPKASVPAVNKEQQQSTMMKEVEENKPKKKKRRSKVTIIVEDASDSEYEDDDLNSIWRHRRPSPGQWMEPIADA